MCHEQVPSLLDPTTTEYYYPAVPAQLGANQFTPSHGGEGSHKGTNMQINTTTRRAARLTTVEDAITDLVVDIEDSVTGLPVAEAEKLVARLRASLDGVTSDPAGVAAGRAPLQLGAGTPTPTPGATTPPITDPVALMAAYVAAQGFDETRVAAFFAATDSPAKLELAIKASLGRMVDASLLTTAEAEVSELKVRIGEIETEAQLPVNSLQPTTRAWKVPFKAKLAVPGVPSTTGMTPMEKAAVKVAYDAIVAGKKQALGGGWLIPTPLSDPQKESLRLLTV
jgi:hypothetical protein